ncbi:MAG: hypothetical protein ILP18_03510 [Treponema sp.]|nr:hypothetical protein [Treponema sp.]
MSEIPTSTNGGRGGRKPYIDTLKLVAVFIVYACHFIRQYHGDYFLKLYYERPWSFLFHGVTGTLGVAFFCVCVGYFAFQSRNRNPLSYLVRRYAYFVLCGFAINLTVALLNNDLSYHVVGVSVRLGYQYFPEYWCMFHFFVASILSYFNAFYKVDGAFIILEMILLCSFGKIWMAICLLGNLAVLAQKRETFSKIMGHRAVRLLLLLVAFVIIKREENDTTYLLYGFASFLLLLVVENSKLLKRLLGFRLFSAPGRNEIAIYLFHTVFYMQFGPLFFKLFGNLAYGLAFVLTLASCWLLLLLVSFPVNFVLEKIMAAVTKRINALLDSPAQP